MYVNSFFWRLAVEYVENSQLNYTNRTASVAGTRPSVI